MMLLRSRFALLAALALGQSAARAADELPRSWVDPDTGHRIVQLSTEPGSASLYFTQYAYTAGGTKLLVTTQRGIDLVTLKTGTIEHAYEGPTSRVLQAGRKTGAIFYVANGYVCSLDPATHRVRQLAKLPPHGSVSTINADETLAAGAITEEVGRSDLAPKLPPPPAGGYKPGQTMLGKDNYPDKAGMMERRLAARLPMTMFTLDLRDGTVRPLLHSHDWLNHFQFSPTDPTLLMFCHEGPWHKVDRIWLIRADGKAEPTLVHQRIMRMETAGHEFWSNDGQWIYYDNKQPQPEVFWVSGYNVYDQRRVKYHVERNQWSVHYNNSPDGRLFSGDGGAETNAAHAKDGKWMYLFYPEKTPDLGAPPGETHLIEPGTFRIERLVNLAKHDYSLEPNGNFTPDGKWLVFRSNLRGPIQVYAVELAKAAESR